MSAISEKVKKQKIMWHKTHPEIEFKLNWYIGATDLQVGMIKHNVDYNDPLKELEQKYPNKALAYIPMDGIWRPVDRYKYLVDRFEYKLQHPLVTLPWYIRTPKAFCILDYFDDEGKPKCA